MMMLAGIRKLSVLTKTGPIKPNVEVLGIAQGHYLRVMRGGAHGVWKPEYAKSGCFG